MICISSLVVRISLFESAKSVQSVAENLVGGGIDEAFVGGDGVGADEVAGDVVHGLEHI